MTGRSAVIVGASGGIGAALADALEADGRFDTVVRLSRSGPGPVAIDLGSEASVASAAAWIKRQGLAPATIIVATGLLHDVRRGPEKSLRDLDPEWLVENYRVNAIGPALVAKYLLPLMEQREAARFAVLSARVGSISDNRLGGWYGYRASKAALNMMVRNLAIEWARRRGDAIIAALHPGTVDTALSEPFQTNVPADKLFAAPRAARQLLAVLDGLTPADSGRIFAWDGVEIQP